MNRLLRCCAVFASACLLSACDDSTLDVDLYADAAGGRYDSVVVTVDAVELVRDGSTETIEIDNPEPVDLLNDGPFRLLDGESLEEGGYDGIRLHFVNDDNDPDDSYVIDADGDRHELLAEGSSSEVGIRFDISEDEGERMLVALTIDALLSVHPRGDDDEEDDYEFEALLRGVLEEDGAAVSGSVQTSLLQSDDCREGRAVGTGAAVYLFANDENEPDDYDNESGTPNPLAAVPVTGSGEAWSYRFEQLPEGSYTLALTCDADGEDPSVNDNEDDDEDFEFLGTFEEIDLQPDDDEDVDIGS